MHVVDPGRAEKKLPFVSQARTESCVKSPITLSPETRPDQETEERLAVFQSGYISLNLDHIPVVSHLMERKRKTPLQSQSENTEAGVFTRPHYQ